MITYTCPSCSAKCTVGDEFAGRKMKCPKCGARIRHHPGGAIELLSPGTPPAPPAATAWNSMDSGSVPASGPTAPAADPRPEGEKKGSTVAVAIVPELVGKLVSQSEEKQNIVVVWGIVAALALSISAVGLLIRELILAVAPIAVALVAAFIWLSIRAKNRHAKGRSKSPARVAAKDEGKTEPLPKS